MATMDEIERENAARCAALMAELRPLPREDKVALIRAAVAYRSGEDSCNSVYMGGMAKTSLRVALGGGMDASLEELLAAATDVRLDKGLEACAHYIDYMRKNPRKKCPCCGQVVPG